MRAERSVRYSMIRSMFESSSSIGVSLVGMRTPALYVLDDDDPALGKNFEKDAPDSNPAPQRSIRAFEKFDVASVGIGAHLLQRVENLLAIGARHIADCATCWVSDYQLPSHVSIDRE